MSYASLEYEKALALGQKEYKACQAKGLPLYPPVLDEVLTGVDTRGEVELGLVDVPIHLITGTRSAGRQRAFSPSFYPLLGADTELAAKWTALCSAHLSEGINEPIKVYEYLHDFYVQEGHKRVSVLRYFGNRPLRPPPVPVGQGAKGALDSGGAAGSLPGLPPLPGGVRRQKRPGTSCQEGHCRGCFGNAYYHLRILPSSGLHRAGA